MQKTTTQHFTTTRTIRFLRICRVIWLTIVGLFIAAILLPLIPAHKRARVIRWWCQHLLMAFNMRVIRSGFVPDNDRPLHNTMVVANHISWSDIHALISVTPLKFIAKSDIRNWPIFGYLAKTNAIFIDRTKRHEAANTVETITAYLKAGANVCLFPEGTTTVGNEVKPFKSSLIQAAIQAESTIYPVAIYYPHPNGGSNTKIAYAGETTLSESMRQLLLQRAPVVELRFLAPIHVKDLTPIEKERRVLTAYIQQRITNALFEQKTKPL